VGALHSLLFVISCSAFFLFSLPQRFSFQNDIRGLPSTTCGKAPPCIIGGCNACHFKGFTGGGGGNTMPGAVMYLGFEGVDLELRKRYFYAVRFVL